MDGGGGRRRGDVDGGWAWVVLLASFMNLLLASGICFVSGIFQKLFLEQFRQSVAFTAWVTALFSSLMQLAGPLSGMLTSATNCRVAVMTGGALLAGGLAASCFATSLHFLFVSFGLIAGTGLGLMYTPTIVVINFFFHRRRTVITGLALSAAGIGIMGTPVLSRFLIDLFSWRETMMILAAVSAHVCVFGAVMFPMHEPPSSCPLLRLCRPRPRPPPQSGDLDPDPSADGNFAAGDPKSVCSEGKGVPASPCSSLAHSGAVVKSGGEGVEAEDVCELKKGDSEDDALIKAQVGDSAERALLLGAESDAAQHLQGKQCADSRTAEIPRHLDLTLQSRQLRTGSRTSLDEVSHRKKGPHSPHTSPNSPQQLSQSAHHLDRPLPHHHHPPPPSQLARSWVKVSVQGPSTTTITTPPGSSQVDLRALAVFPSLHSLQGVGGVVTPVPDLDLLTSSTPALGRGGEGGQWKVMTKPSFVFLCVNLFLSNMACGILNIHLPAFSQQRGLDDQDITLVLALDGVAVFLSRALVGAMGHDDRVDKLAVYFGLHLIASFVQASLPWTETLAGVTALVILMGIYYGSVYSLLSSLTISILGLPSLAFALGVEMICAGLGYLVAPPLAGWIVDVTGDYNNSMYFGGLLMLLSALSLLCVTCCRPPGSPPVGYLPPAPDIHVEVRLDGEEEEEGEEEGGGVLQNGVKG
ncbi:monocarboxylate transporter 14-like isoform X1 [Babylonia areolata]|uniref:monocarboxylate transporter 14-like isoform X1 n=1 Tax=Babylonia areolata TaxID=304850 RepID=UPI003FCF5A37